MGKKEWKNIWRWRGVWRYRSGIIKGLMIWRFIVDNWKELLGVWLGLKEIFISRSRMVG